MANQVEEKARGILNPTTGAQMFALARYKPSAELAALVEHYWVVRWDLREQAPYRSETLAHPAIHLTVEPEGAFIVGVVTRKYSRLLDGEGRVFGIKFRPAGFYPFVQEAVSAFTDKVLTLAERFGAASIVYEADVRGTDGDEEKLAIAEGFLHQRIAELGVTIDENVMRVNQIVERIGSDRTITKVDEVVSRFSINKRALQRLFSQYVGVSPKWVIQRYRLHEATEQVAAGESIDWAKLAVDLGYFDQAHLIKDFKAMIGLTPVEYAAVVRKGNNLA
jgi:AraC-like DNA-binding protein